MKIYVENSKTLRSIHEWFDEVEKKKKEHEVINNKVEKIKIIEESIHTRNAVLTFF